MDRVQRKIDLSELLYQLFWHALYCILMWAWYRVFLFRCFLNLSLSESRTLLFCIVISSALLGCMIDKFILKKEIHTFINMMTGFGIYAALTYIKIKPLLIILSVVVSLVLAVLNYILTTRKRVTSSENHRKVIIQRTYNALSGSKAIMSLGFGVIIASIGIPLIIGGFIARPTVSPAKTVASQEWNISNNIEELSLFFDEEGWDKASLTTKLNTCQVLANVCQAELGINELNVVTANTSDIIAGYYNDQEHQIMINLDYLMSASGPDVCDTVIHEAYHAYEHRIVDAYLAAPEDMQGLALYQNAATYMKEFENYQDCNSLDSDDYYAYASQLCELHARIYAEIITADIENAVKEYWGETNG